ncbi:MAG: ABC transporter permease subunit [Planctomycetes bacterium]|nr:ABC transporter permease subunit [Planctomycetota bacterium]
MPKLLHKLARPLRLVDRGAFGPVFQRDARIASKRTSAFWIRGLYALGLIALTSLIYIADSMDRRFTYMGPAATIQQLQRFAPMLGAFYIWFQFGIACLIASILTAGAICEDRKKGSLSSLLATPLTPGQIVLGKLTGNLTQLVVIIAVGLPLLLAIRLFGGVSPRFVFTGTLLALSTAVVHASISLAASARVRSTTAAASSGVISGVLWGLAPMFVTLLLMLSSRRPGLTGFPEFVMSLSPYYSLGVETIASFGRVPGLDDTGWIYAVMYNVLGSSFFLWIATTRLRSLAIAGETSAPAPTPKAKEKRSAIGLSDALNVSDNPVRWRELRQPLFARKWHPYVFTGAVVAILSYVYSQVGVASGEVLTVVSAILLTLLYFQASLIASNSIAGERESRSFEVLLTTPLTARQIIVAKWLGAMRRVLPPFVLYYALVLVLGILPGTFALPLLIHLPLTVLPPLAFLVATGVWFSVLLRRSTGAATVNLLFGVAIWILLPMLVGITYGMLHQFIGNAQFDDTLSSLLVTNPAPMTLTALQGARESVWGPSASERRYHTFLPFSLLTFTLTCLLFALSYGLFTWLALRGASRSLAHRTFRIPARL